MGWTAAARRQAQSFDRIAAGYDRHQELSGRDNPAIDAWLATVLPARGRRAADLGCGTGRLAAALADRFGHVTAIDVSGPMIERASAARARPNVTYQRADLREVTGQYHFVVSVRALHHMPDLCAALRHISALVAPGGRLAVMDGYRIAGAHAAMERLLPLRPRLHGLALRWLASNLCTKGPKAAWEIYRLDIRKEWLDHRVSDRFFSRAELERCCAALFPGCRLDAIGGPRTIGLVWDKPGEAVKNHKVAR